MSEGGKPSFLIATDFEFQLFHVIVLLVPEKVQLLGAFSKCNRSASFSVYIMVEIQMF